MSNVEFILEPDMARYKPIDTRYRNDQTARQPARRPALHARSKTGGMAASSLRNAAQACIVRLPTDQPRRESRR